MIAVFITRRTYLRFLRAHSHATFNFNSEKKVDMAYGYHLILFIMPLCIYNLDHPQHAAGPGPQGVRARASLRVPKAALGVQDECTSQVLPGVAQGGACTTIRSPS